MYTCRGLHAAGRAVTSFWLQVVLLEDVEREGNNLSVIDGSLTRLVFVSFWVDSYPRHFHLQESMAGEPRSSAAARFAARLADFAAMRSNEVTGLALRRLATGPTFAVNSCFRQAGEMLLRSDDLQRCSQTSFATLLCSFGPCSAART